MNDRSDDSEGQQVTQGTGAQLENLFAMTGWLPRFANPRIEEEYCRSVYEAATSARVYSYILATVAAVLSPLGAHALLSSAPELIPMYMVGGLGIEAPVFLLAIWVSSRKNLSIRTASILQVCFLVVLEGVAINLRIQLARYNIAFPSSATILGFCIFVAVFGLPLRHTAPSLLVFFCITKALELKFMNLTPQDYASGGVDAIFSIITIITTARGDRSQRQSFSRLAITEKLAYMDALTGLSNRLGFRKEAERIIRQAVRQNRPVSLAAVDVDQFAALSESAGHAFANFVLSQLGQCLGTLVRRPLDAAGHMEGDDFLLLWFDPSPEFRDGIGERVVAAVRELKIRSREHPGALVTVSVGVATVVPKAEGDFDLLLRQADQCLYQAKAAGRDASRTTVQASW